MVAALDRTNTGEIFDLYWDYEEWGAVAVKLYSDYAAGLGSYGKWVGKLGDARALAAAFDRITGSEQAQRLSLEESKELELRGSYSLQYAQKMKAVYAVFKKYGYIFSEHSLNRVLGRINQGKIKSLDDVIDVLVSGEKYLDKEYGGIVIFKNGISVHVAEDGKVTTVIGNAKIKETWEHIE